ncbi:MAG: transketolase C-terminal domain-containing protein [Bacteroidota bacterium]|nr:transketolase C-terminal domain-containing protein [Bacteroidota bacterium]MDP4232991.1 transketolase C-terminal domain-containing protein [Bacteroidota bacterium]MDP4242035.1 transketolase C-terminal domain-containing protein [Bacteroidota bacterium]MDP4286938.1 transketolase C-terminal domain-containing protein [Bacteroidota bacterium]
MLKQIEGSRAVAESIALCRPKVVCAYPITPQTHIVEGLGEMVRTGELPDCEFINVESEFAAMSVAIGSSAAGVRTYTATSSQGLLFMTEAVYNASGMGLPIVMTLGTRAIGAPINIWNDHSDAMALRDAGWIMLFAESNQEALDLHVQAFRIAEELGTPVMVCVDGFILTHAYERLDLPPLEQVQAFVGPFKPAYEFDPKHPMSAGSLVGPEAFAEVRYLAHRKQLQALELIPQIAVEFEAMFARDSGGLIHSYGVEGASTIVVAMGSVIGTILDVCDELREAGHSIGTLAITSYRPFPVAAVREALKHAERVIVIEKSITAGMGGPLTADIRLALDRLQIPLQSVIAGLGGRPITKDSLLKLLQRAPHDEVPDTTFLDLNWDMIRNELEQLEVS